MGEGEIRTIGQLVATRGGSIKTGPFGTSLKASEYSSVGVPLISVGEVGYGVFRVDDATPRVPVEVTERLPEYVLQEGDIVFGRKGAVDRSARVTAEQAGWFLGSDGIRLRLPKSTDSRFVAYHLQSAASRSWILQHATGTTMPSLNQNVIERVPIDLPTLGQQRAIAAVLGALDDKIDLNRRMNETLEEIARALFKSWFVDFDPVRAKAEGRRPFGMDAETAALFPDGFEQTELGEVPRGWRSTTWEEIAVLEYGKSLRDYGDAGSIPVFGTNGPIGFTHTALCSHEGVVVGRKGAYRGIHFSPRPFFVIDTAFYLEARIPISWRWVYYELLQFDLNAMDSGSAIPSTSRPAFYRIPVCVPPTVLHDAFDEFLGPVWKRAESAEAESRTLATLRDYLLPKLLSGEVRVRDAEKIVGGAV